MTQPAVFDVSPEGWVPDALPHLNGERVIRLDAETDGLMWWDGARPVGWAWYLPASGRRGYSAFAHKGGGNACSEEAALEWSRRELRGVHIDNANTKFDVHIAREWGVDLVAQGCTFGDVQHRAALLDDHRFHFNLDQLAQDFLGPDRGKVQLPFVKSQLHYAPAWAVAPYATEDVVLVHDLTQIMDPEIAKQDLTRVHKLEQDIIPVVVEMEKNGVYLDMDRLFEWQRRATREYNDQLFYIYRETGFEFTSPDSGKQLAELFRRRGIPITTFTNAGKPSFTEDVLRRAAEHDPVIKAAFYASQLADLLSKYLNKYTATVRTDGWIRFNLHQLRTSKGEDEAFGTVSGRFSSAGDKDEDGKSVGFNVQQVVSADKQTSRNWCSDYIIRDLFLPGDHAERGGATPPLWLAADAKQIEYRIFAHFANTPGVTGRYTAPPPYEFEVDESGKKTYLTGPETEYHTIVQKLLQKAKPNIGRKQTKITNFCKLFGAGLLKFCWTLGTISDKEFADLDAKYRNVRGKNRLLREEPALREGLEVYDAYDESFPAAVEMLERAKKIATERGYVKTMLGRRARFTGSYKRVHSALNRVIQGTAADLNKLMLVDVYRERQALGLTLRFTVHDELDADLKDESKLPLIREFMDQQRLDLRVPILWDVSVGPTWGKAKGKA